MTLAFRNRQRTRALDVRFLRKVTLFLLREEMGLPDTELGIHLVSPEEMARVNETYLNHTGSTDVITFDHADEPLDKAGAATGVHGELFICVADAIGFAKEFKTSWQHEVVRYVVHGVLHLRGYDDLKPALRREMKREENRLMRRMESCFDLRKLAIKGK